MEFFGICQNFFLSNIRGGGRPIRGRDQPTNQSEGSYETITDELSKMDRLMESNLNSPFKSNNKRLHGFRVSGFFPSVTLVTNTALLGIVTNLRRCDYLGGYD